MAPARLSALGAVVLAVWLAASLPLSRGAGIVSLIGWLGVALLVVGLVMGYRGAVAATAVAFVIRTALVAPFDVEMRPPLWAQALLIVLVVELSGASFTWRSRPADTMLVLTRALAISVAASALVQALAVLVEGAEASGVLVRVAGVAAVVIAAGWVARVWRRSGLSG
ncbi:MAG: hypothetical protein ACRDWS_14510 [Acidimicrobiia bacterium]